MTPSLARHAHRLGALGVLTTLLVSLLALAEHDAPQGDATRSILPAAMQPLWVEACSTCHMAYAPALLPERSWRAIMGNLDAHFGGHAQLDLATQDTVTGFLAENSMDRVNTPRTAAWNRSIPRATTPARITTSPWFVRTHHDVKAAVFARPSIRTAGNCLACHAGAQKGVFSEESVRIPH